MQTLYINPRPAHRQRINYPSLFKNSAVLCPSMVKTTPQNHYPGEKWESDKNRNKTQQLSQRQTAGTAPAIQAHSNCKLIAKPALTACKTITCMRPTLLYPHIFEVQNRTSYVLHNEKTQQQGGVRAIDEHDSFLNDRSRCIDAGTAIPLRNRPIHDSAEEQLGPQQYHHHPIRGEKCPAHLQHGRQNRERSPYGPGLVAASGISKQLYSYVPSTVMVWRTHIMEALCLHFSFYDPIITRLHLT
jgi:hypothetical protein